MVPCRAGRVTGIAGRAIRQKPAQTRTDFTKSNTPSRSQGRDTTIRLFREQIRHLVSLNASTDAPRITQIPPATALA